jgi:hypothetical protein
MEIKSAMLGLTWSPLVSRYLAQLLTKQKLQKTAD